MIIKQEEQVYRSAEGINYSSLKAGIDKSLKHMHHAMTGGYSKSTAAQNIGKLAHALILEPQKFGATVAVWTGYTKKDGEISMSKNSNAYKDFVADNEGKDIITPEMLQILEAIKDAVYRNNQARKALEGSQKEISCYWKDVQYGKGKALIDVLCKDGMRYDVKTCDDISRFERAAIRYGYHYQSGWYSHGLEANGITAPDYPFGWIVVETSPPYDVAVLPCDYTLAEIGYNACRECAIAYRQAEATGVFPGVFADNQILEAPMWMLEGVGDLDFSE